LPWLYSASQKYKTTRATKIARKIRISFAFIKGSQYLDDNVSCIEARQPDFEQRPLDDVFLYQGFRRLLNKRCVIARRELTLDVQHEDAECQRLRLITSRP
jgi:hypothetical protein